MNEFGVHALVMDNCARNFMLFFDWQVVEISKGSKVKYELDKNTGLIKVLDLSSTYLRKVRRSFCSQFMTSSHFR